MRDVFRKKCESVIFVVSGLFDIFNSSPNSSRENKIKLFSMARKKNLAIPLNLLSFFSNRPNAASMIPELEFLKSQWGPGTEEE
jgi:hypothetical protein